MASRFIGAAVVLLSWHEAYWKMYRKNAPALGRPIALRMRQNEKKWNFYFQDKIAIFLTQAGEAWNDFTGMKKLLPAVLDNFELVCIGDGARV